MTMPEIKNKITTKTEIFVTSKCLRGLDHPVYKLNYEMCKTCPLLISDSECGYKEYITVAKENIDYDEDDGSGGMPCDTYMWHIPCSNCGEEILFTSGLSSLQLGDNEKCRKCGLEHFYVKWIEDKKYMFGIPIKNKEVVNKRIKFFKEQKW